MAERLKVLFLCTGNSCRSQMAEGWTRALKGDAIEAFSAGIETHGLNPHAVTVMAEAGVDISQQRSQLLDEFADYIDSRFGGIPEAIRDNRDALGVFLPIIQYDMSLLESYEHQTRDPLPVPITALGGTRDRAVSREKLEAWSEFTSKKFSLTMIEGDHFFPASDLQSIIQSAETMFDQ